MSELKKILYAEDEPDIRDVAVVALEVVGGFELKVCEDGQAAVDAVSGFQPDLILLDVMMPELTGPEALGAIRKITGFEQTPVIFMTAKVQPQEVDEYIKMGALHVIPKPFDPMTLAETILMIWNKRSS